MHPDTGVDVSSVEKDVEIKDGETTQLDIEFPYKVPKPPPKPKPGTAPPIIK